MGCSSFFRSCLHNLLLCSWHKDVVIARSKELLQMTVPAEMSAMVTVSTTVTVTLTITVIQC